MAKNHALTIEIDLNCGTLAGIERDGEEIGQKLFNKGPFATHSAY